MNKSKIIKLKKRFWKLYSLEFNCNSDAFELMRQIGVEQGKELTEEDLKWTKNLEMRMEFYLEK